MPSAFASAAAAWRRTQYQNNGYMIVPGVITPEEIDTMASVISRYRDDGGPLLRPHVPKHLATPERRRELQFHIVDFAADSTLRPLFDRVDGSARLHRALTGIFGEGEYEHFPRTEISINRNLKYHRDIIAAQRASPLLQYMQGVGPWDKAPDGKEQQLLIAVLYMQDHSADNRSLTLVPGTHQSHGGTPFPHVAMPRSAPTPHTLHPRKGDAVLFDFRLLHRGQERGPLRRSELGPPDDRVQLGVAYGRTNLHTRMWDRAIRMRNALEVNTSMCGPDGLKAYSCSARFVAEDLERNPIRGMPGAAAPASTASSKAKLEAELLEVRRKLSPLVREEAALLKELVALPPAATTDSPPAAAAARRGLQGKRTGKRADASNDAAAGRGALPEQKGVVFVVGASRGIGLELARQYAALGWQVHGTTRNISTPGALGEVRGVTLHALDVTDEAQIGALADATDNLAVDVLIHNAGIQTTDRDEAMRVNAEAPFKVVKALLPAVLRSALKTVCLMTSADAGSRARERRSKGKLGAYGASKLAMNVKFQADEPAWRAQGVTAFLLHPGWAKTDMGGTRAQITVDTSVRGMIQVVGAAKPTDSGACLQYDGKRCDPWK